MPAFEEPETNKQKILRAANIFVFLKFLFHRGEIYNFELQCLKNVENNLKGES